MATKSAQQEPEKAEVVEELLDTLDTTLDRVKVLYEQYFLGIQKQPPTYLHTDVERKLRDLAQMQIRNTALRYRFATLQQKFGSYNSYWRRTLRQIENGTYTRNLSKIGRQVARTGAAVPEEILAAMPKRMREQVVRDREAALALARRREHPPSDPDLLTLAEDVDVDLDDLGPAFISESTELRRDALTAGGAHRIDESDADFDLDAFFASMTSQDEPPPLESLRSSPSAAPSVAPRAPSSRGVSWRVPTPRTEPRPPPPSRPTGHPRPGTLSGSPIAGIPEDVRLTRAEPRAHTEEPALGPAGAASRARTEQPGSGPAGGARAKTVHPELGPAGAGQPRARTEPPEARAPEPRPVQADRAASNATQAVPSIKPGPTQAVPPIKPGPTQAVPSIKPGPTQAVPSIKPGPTQAVPSIKPGPTQAMPRTSEPLPSSAVKPPALAPSQATRSIPVVPGASAARASTPVESLSGPFPRIPSIPSLPSNLRTTSSIPPARAAPPEARPDAAPEPAAPGARPSSEPAAAPPPAQVSVTMRVPTERAATPERAPPGERAAPARQPPSRLPPSERRPPEPRQGPPPGMTDADVNVLYAKYVKAKEILGEEADPGAYGKLLKTINAQAPKIMEQYNARSVDFSVVVKDNQVIIRAKPKP